MSKVDKKLDDTNLMLEMRPSLPKLIITFENEETKLVLECVTQKLPPVNF